MPTKILLAYDGSEPADKAYAFAIDFALHYGASLIVLSVARPPEPPEDVETEAMLESAQEHYEQRFEVMRRQAEARGLKPEFKVAIGHPAEQIIYAAEKEGVDHIVTGHRGRTFFGRWRLGSVSTRIIQYAHCAVTVVR